MKKKASKQTTERKTNIKSKNLKQKIKQVVNVNIHTGRRGKGISKAKSSPAQRQNMTPSFVPSFAPSFAPVVSQPNPIVSSDLISLVNLLKQKAEVPNKVLIKTPIDDKEAIKIPTEKKKPEISIGKTYESDTIDYPTHPPNIPINIENPLKKGRRGRPPKTEEEKLATKQAYKEKQKQRKEEQKQQMKQSENDEVVSATPLLNIEAVESSAKKKSKEKVYNVNIDKQYRIPDYFTKGQSTAYDKKYNDEDTDYFRSKLDEETKITKKKIKNNNNSQPSLFDLGSNSIFESV
jgi:hypothetical protein